DLRVVPAGFGDGGLEVVEHNPVGYAAEKLEGVAVQHEPGCDTLVPDKFDVLVTAEAEHHHEGPGFTHLPGLWVEHTPGIAKVNLGLFARGGFYSAIRLGLSRLQGAHEAADCRIAARIAALFQAFPNGHHFG